MANFKDSNTFSTHDDYYTRKETWEIVKKQLQSSNKFVVIDKKQPRIYDPCLLGAKEQSIQYWKDLGYEICGDNKNDFLIDNKYKPKENYDMIITNVPFQRIDTKNVEGSLKYQIIKKIFSYNKHFDIPFCFIINSTNLHQKWFQRLVESSLDKGVNIIFPSFKINYDKYIGQEKVETKQDYKKKLGIKNIKSFTEEQKKYYNKLPCANSCSFNTVFVCSPDWLESNKFI